jgi:hypothetical protein
MKRKKGPAPGAEPWKDKSLVPLWMDTREFPAVADRAARAMQIGGATLEDIRIVYGVLRVQSAMHPINYENSLLAAKRRTQDKAIRRINSVPTKKRRGDQEYVSQPVTPEQRAAVGNLDRELHGQFPKPYVRAREIAARTGMTQRRVEYVMGLRKPRPRKK